MEFTPLSKKIAKNLKLSPRRGNLTGHYCQFAGPSLPHCSKSATFYCSPQWAVPSLTPLLSAFALLCVPVYVTHLASLHQISYILLLMLTTACCYPHEDCADIDTSPLRLEMCITECVCLHRTGSKRLCHPKLSRLLHHLSLIHI